MKQEEYWNGVSEKKEFTTPFQAEAFSKYVKRDSCILDMGCGYGRTLDELYQNGYRNLIGIDFSSGMIERGKQQFPYLDLRVKENTEIALKDSSVDAVILFAVLTCIRTNEEQEQLLSEIKRVLKPGGILYVNDFLLNTDERNLLRYEKFKETYGIYGVFELPEGIVCRHHDEIWIKQLLKDFSEREYEHLTFTTMNGHKSNGFYFIGELMVHPEMQKKGIGTKLLLEIENEYPNQRYELFTSTKSISNIRLYERLGYKIFKEETASSELQFVYLQKY